MRRFLLIFRFASAEESDHFHAAGLAWWECDALQEGGRGQVRPSRVHPCAAAATAASSSTGNIPPDPSDATAKHGPCLM